MRFGARFNADCENLRQAHGGTLQWSSGIWVCISWVDELLYALLISVSAVIIKLLMQCSVFSNVGRFASEKVVLDLIRNKCLPVLLYGEEACPMLVRDKRSLELTVTRPLMKLFQAGYATVVGDCMHFFLLLASASQSSNRYSYGKNFWKNFTCSENYRVAQKSKPLPNYQKNCVKSY